MIEVEGKSGPQGAPRVVVVIPAWRATGTIGRAVVSALTQTEPCHVVVVDDASPDDTAAAARAADDGSGRLTVLTQPQNAGPAAARNRAIAASSAPWIALLDSDDVMEPERIAGLLALAEPEGKADWDMVADDLLRVTEGPLDGPRDRLISGTDFEPYALDFTGFVLGNVHGSRGSRGELGFIKPLIRRKFLEEAGLSYDETMRLGEDYDLYARALARGARVLVTNPLGYLAVARTGSLSDRHGTRELGQIVAADRALLATEAMDAAGKAAVRQHLARVQREWTWMRLIDAVKARAPLQILGCFASPPAIIMSLIGRLAGQVVIRTGRLLGLGRA